MFIQIDYLLSSRILSQTINYVAKRLTSQQVMMKYEKWSLGYWCFKQYVRFAEWLIYKRKIVTGKEKIPKDKPIVFAPNHQNALSDAMAVLLNTRHQPVWLSRADIFKPGIITTLLRFLKMMPAYRLRDGKKNLANNDKTFADSIKILEHHSSLALYPEAAQSGKRQMLAHKKAVPRIVFMAEENTEQNLDIHIIPIGIYYSSYWKFNRTLIVNYGDPILVNNYFKEYKENPNAAILLLREKIHKAIQSLVIDFKTKKYYADFEKIRGIYGSHFLKRQNKQVSTLNLFKSDQILVEKLDILETEKPEEIDNLVKKANAYNALIKKLRIRNWLVENPKNNILNIALNKLILIIGLPIFIFGFLFNAIPYFLIDTIVRKKVKDIAFWSTFFLAPGLFLFPITYLLELFAFSWLIPGIWMKLAFLISLPFAGKLAFKWYILFRKTAGRSRLLLLKLFNKNKHKQLLNQRKTLMDELDKLISI